MTIYGLTRVKLDSHGRIELARLRELDPMSSSWVGDAMEMPANQVVRLIGSGSVVHSIFPPSPKHPFPRHGARFRIKNFAGAGLGIELEREADGRTLSDLAKID
jgi:hypothetical protein